MQSVIKSKELSKLDQAQPAIAITMQETTQKPRKYPVARDTRHSQGTSISNKIGRDIDQRQALAGSVQDMYITEPWQFTSKK